MKNYYTTLVASTLLIGSFTVYANDMALANFDADRNGTVSEQEFNDARNAMIAGKAKEGRQMRGLANVKSFADFDANQDGQLTADEMAVMQKGSSTVERKGLGVPPAPAFTDFDANKDGALTEQEFNESRNKRIGDRAKEGRQMKGLANMASFADMDGNADKKVTADEFALFLTEHKKKGH